MLPDLEEPKETTEASEPTTQEVSSDEWITDESDSNCAGSFYYPSGCKGPECKYVAKWELNSEKNNLRLRLESQLPTKQYTAFGFSRDGSMVSLKFKSKIRFIFRQTLMQSLFLFWEILPLKSVTNSLRAMVVLLSMLHKI